MNHVAFHADSRKMVDEFHTKYLRPKGIPILYGGPRERPEYSKGYYSVYFEDPDRIKLELVYTPGAQNLRSRKPGDQVPTLTGSRFHLKNVGLTGCA